MPKEVVLKGMNTFQVNGSGITYYRRYAISSAFGLVTVVDSDANGEEKPKPTKEQWKAIVEKQTPLDTILKHFSLSDEQTKIVKTF